MSLASLVSDVAHSTMPVCGMYTLKLLTREKAGTNMIAKF